MVSGLISDSQITASNQGERSWMPENIRLVTSRSGWVLPPGPQSYINEWLQVDLGEEKIVRGIIIQGGKHRENKVSMRKFKIGYSNNGSDWKMIMDDSKRKAKVRSRGRERLLEEVLPQVLDLSQKSPAFFQGSETYFFSAVRPVEVCGSVSKIPSSRADRFGVQKVMSEMNMGKNCIAGHFFLSYLGMVDSSTYRRQGNCEDWDQGIDSNNLVGTQKSLCTF